MKLYPEKFCQSRAKPFSSGSSRRTRRASQLTSLVSRQTRRPAFRPSAAVTESLDFIRDLPLRPNLSGKLVQMPSRQGKTLVVDLDETLVHCVPSNAEVTLPVSFPNGRITRIGLNIRPFARTFLENAARLFEVVVFTASHKRYADAVLNYLDPHQQFVSLRLYRNNCVFVNGVFVKDLRVLAGRQLSDVVIVDNAVHSFGYQLDNGVPITSWYDNYDDCELSKVWDYLQVLATQDDVRLANAETFGLRKLASTLTQSLSQAFLECSLKKL